MSRYIDRIISGALVVAALAMATAVVSRTFADPVRTRQNSGPPVKVAFWEEALAVGNSSGPPNAAVTIVEFMDFECPGCRAFNEVVREVQAQHRKEVRVVYVPFPLPMHRFALPAARAADCAVAAGRFAAFSDVLFAHQDSLGLKSWGSLAHDAGIADTAEIAACAANPAPRKAVTAGETLARRVGLGGTPTIVVNGWQLPRTPTTSELEEMVTAILAGKSLAELR
jgi:protein-disulfide isomerase